MTLNIARKTRISVSLTIVMLWGLLLAIVAAVNVTTELSDHRRLGVGLDLWEPLVWETSSALMIAVLIPPAAWACRRFPLTARNWLHTLPVHALLTLPFSLVHVAGMVALRKLSYALGGYSYDFGPPLAGFLYEYRKDVLAYAAIVAAVTLLRNWRAQKEAGSPGRAESAAPSQVLTLKCGTGTIFLDPGDVVWMQAAGNYTVIHTRRGRHEVRGSLEGLLGLLPRARFRRVHRSHALAVDQVARIDRKAGGDGEALLRCGQRLRVSRRYRQALESAMTPYGATASGGKAKATT